MTNTLDDPGIHRSGPTRTKESRERQTNIDTESRRQTEKGTDKQIWRETHVEADRKKQKTNRNRQDRKRMNRHTDIKTGRKRWEKNMVFHDVMICLRSFLYFFISGSTSKEKIWPFYFNHTSAHWESAVKDTCQQPTAADCTPPRRKGSAPAPRGYFDTNLQLHPKPDTWSHFCRWQHVKMAHCRGISTPLRAGITVDLTHPGPINLESLGLKHCWLLQAAQGNQEAKRSGSFCLRSYVWVVTFKPESNAGNQVPWCLTPEHTRVPT